jgi:hypothetical protein
MVVDQLLLRLRDRTLNRIELLRQVKAGTAIRKHRYDFVKMPFGQPQAFDDAGVRFVDGCSRLHLATLFVGTDDDKTGRPSQAERDANLRVEDGCLRVVGSRRY